MFNAVNCNPPDKGRDPARGGHLETHLKYHSVPTYVTVHN